MGGWRESKGVDDERGGMGRGGEVATRQATSVLRPTSHVGVQVGPHTIGKPNKHERQGRSFAGNGCVDTHPLELRGRPN